jgi:serine/threonine protein kinase
MSQSAKKDWKVLREFNVDLWKRGFVVEDGDANRRIIIKALNREHPWDNPYQRQGHAVLGEWSDSQIPFDDFLAKEEADFRAAASDFLNLPHENVAAVYEIGADNDGCGTAVMEYFFGSPFTTELYMAPLNIVLAHFKQLLEGLAFIHELGRLYLHVRQSFILSDITAGKTKIINWWQTRKKGEPFGKHENFVTYYIAPEIFLDAHADELSDVYAMGALIYRIWMGKAPYIRSFLPRVFVDQLEKEAEINPKDMLKNSNDKSELKFCELISQLLRKNPGDRGFKNAREVVGYIIDSWPDAAKPAKELYGGVMTTIRM